MVRPGGPPHAPPAITRPAPARSRARGARRARKVPAGMAWRRARGHVPGTAPRDGYPRATRRGRGPAVGGGGPAPLEELGALGEVAWMGRGSLGRDDGRVVLYRPGRDALRPDGPADVGDR